MDISQSTNDQIALTRGVIHFYNDIQVEDRNKLLSGDSGIVDHHFGFDDPNVKYNFDELSDATIASIVRRQEEKQSEVLIKSMGEVSSNHIVLDAGCGRGGTAFRLVLAKNCNVVGITIAPYQTNFATQAALKLGLSSKTKFQTMDMLKPSFADNSFDHIITNETTQYILDLDKLFSNFRKLLKPGGKYTLATWNINRNYKKNNIYIDPINSHYGVHMHYDDEYLTALNNNGFEIVSDENLTDLTIPHWEVRSHWSQASGVEKYFLNGHKENAIFYKIISGIINK